MVGRLIVETTESRWTEMSISLEDLLSRLKGVRASETGHMAKCPAHDDAKASLSVKGASDGTILLKCFAYCDTGKVTAALGLTLRDLFPASRPSGLLPRPRSAVSSNTKPSPDGHEHTTEQLRSRPSTVAMYVYENSEGNPVFAVLRTRDKEFPQYRAAGLDRWLTGVGNTPRVLYRLPRILDTAGSGGQIFIAEGEKDVHTLESLGLVATTAPGGSSAKWLDSYTGVLKDSHVVILPDNDEPGRKHARKVAAALQGRAASVKVLELPGLPEKGDVSDWAGAGGTADKLCALVEAAPVVTAEMVATEDQPGSSGEPVEETLEYEERNGHLYWLVPTRNGERNPRQIANFTARIVYQIHETDGVNTEKGYELEVIHRGTPRRFRVPAAEFQALGWIARELDAGASVEPGQIARDRLPHGIRQLSGEVPSRQIFAHTGWIRIGEEALYLTRGGALGCTGLRDDVEASLPDDLQCYHLPAPPEGIECVEAIHASLDLLDVTDRRVAFVVLAAVYRSIIGNSPFTVWLEGGSGEGKSTLAIWAQAHFGAGFVKRGLPGSWSSTGNALEASAFSAKDALLAIDDFAPSKSRSAAERLTATVNQVLRAQGNKAGRGRLRPDGKRRPDHPPRGLILSTGEDFPGDHSIRARTVVVEIAKGSARLSREQLGRVQEQAERGVLALSMAGFVRWLAGRFDEVQAGLQSREELARQSQVAENEHSRTAGNLAALYVGFDLFLMFAVEAGAIDLGRADLLRSECAEALRNVGRGQAVLNQESKPCARFLRLISSSLSSCRAHLARRDGKAPDDPGRFGWKTDGGVSLSCGERIGWIDGEDIFLEPTAAPRVAFRMAFEEGEPFGLGAKAVTKRLRESGYLASTESHLGKNTVRRTIGDGQRHVLHLLVGVLFGTNEDQRIGQSKSGYESEPGSSKPAPEAVKATSPISPISAHIRVYSKTDTGQRSPEPAVNGRTPAGEMSSIATCREASFPEKVRDDDIPF